MAISLGALRASLLKEHEDGDTWEVIGERREVHKAVVWRVANTNYEPKDPVLRARLDLPTSASVQILNGIIVHDGSLVMTGDKHCSCGRMFVPNVPWRQYCPICRPVKK
jgi:hypothetical protein